LAEGESWAWFPNLAQNISHVCWDLHQFRPEIHSSASKSCKLVQKPGLLVYTIVLSKTKFENFSEPKQHKIVFVLVFKNVENRQPVIKCQTRSIQCQTRCGSYLAKSPWLLGSQVNPFKIYLSSHPSLTMLSKPMKENSL
jgi:hypothetical protein